MRVHRCRDADGGHEHLPRGRAGLRGRLLDDGPCGREAEVGVFVPAHDGAFGPADDLTAERRDECRDPVLPHVESDHERGVRGEFVAPGGSSPPVVTGGPGVVELTDPPAVGEGVAGVQHGGAGQAGPVHDVARRERTVVEGVGGGEFDARPARLDPRFRHGVTVAGLHY